MAMQGKDIDIHPDEPLQTTVPYRTGQSPHDAGEDRHEIRRCHTALRYLLAQPIMNMARPKSGHRPGTVEAETGCWKRHS